jgi:uncharacterized protein YjdB
MRHILPICIVSLLLLGSCTKKDQPEKDKTETEVKGKVSFPNAEEQVLVDDSIQLNYSTDPAKLKDTMRVTWMSDNENIAKVSPTGMVKGVGIGEAGITVKSSDGKLSASVKVLVGEVKVSSIKFQSRYQIAYLNERTLLPLTINPSNATHKQLTWSTYQHDIITLEQNGHVTATKPGYALVTVSQGAVSDYCVIIPSKRSQEASGAYVGITGFNPTKHSWEVYLANTGSEKITVTEVKLFTGSSLTEEAGTSTETIILDPGTAGKIAAIGLTESFFNALSANSFVRIEATIGARRVYITMTKDKETTISNR